MCSRFSDIPRKKLIEEMPMSSTPIAGKTAFVTGAAGGLGRTIVGGLITAGARVFATDVDEVGLAALARDVEAKHGKDRVATRRLDISDYRACADAVAAADAALGKIDILVNNGALGMGVIRADHMTNLVGIEEIKPEVWDRFVAVNLSGGWYLTRAVIPGMKARKSGRIINVTTSFFTMLRGRFHPYGPVKAGFEAMSAGHAQEFEPFGITVNVVVPGGPADTAMVPPESGMDRAELIPPSAMVPPIVWLASDAGAGATGHRYIAAKWKAGQPLEANRAAAESPIAWPDLATAPVWPGGKPNA
jgi:NAD(P)-dependent dehydrogenase (short-subunit alcohol dehydrogenase family)